MNKYLAQYGRKKIEVEADTSYSAQKQAQEVFKLKDRKRHLISIFLVAKADSTPVETSTAAL